ncbi:MAG: hypothetical protein KDI07_02715 [Anaerolineae bacterium]|nr:hypothetical protein [Anaerolineae bacterium]
MDTDKGNVIQLPVITRLDLNADLTLKNLAGKLDGFVLAGYDKDGNEFFSSTYADGGDALWLLERCKLALLTVES